MCTWSPLFEFNAAPVELPVCQPVCLGQSLLVSVSLSVLAKLEHKVLRTSSAHAHNCETHQCLHSKLLSRLQYPPGAAKHQQPNIAALVHESRQPGGHQRLGVAVEMASDTAAYAAGIDTQQVCDQLCCCCSPLLTCRAVQGLAQVWKDREKDAGAAAVQLQSPADLSTHSD